MLQCSTSLWSADLTRLAAEIKRVEPYSDRFHFDAADGHYVPTLLFFPDLVKQLRPLTQVPFEVHLMVTDPLAWIDPFVEAGADILIVCLNATRHPADVLGAIRARGKQAGLSLQPEEPLDPLQPLWPSLDLLTLLGTPAGIKGATMDPAIPAKIQQARRIIDEGGWRTLVEADGGIRRHTVPLLRAAGADYVVAGSLIFRDDPECVRRWMDGLPSAPPA